jgi:hypothetical protein
MFENMQIEDIYTCGSRIKLGAWVLLKWFPLRKKIEGIEGDSTRSFHSTYSVLFFKINLK